MARGDGQPVGLPGAARGGFNLATVAGLTCHDTLPVGWDGQVYDCDFNQMLGLAARGPDGRALRVADLDPAALGRRRVRTGGHCFGCTAGAGSSCGGATVETGTAL